MIDINSNLEEIQYDLVLCKLNEEPLQELYNIEDFEIKKYHVNVDEISFTVPFHITNDNGEQVKNILYDLVDGSMLVKVNDMQYFVLTKPEIKANEETGEIYKSIIGFSREYEFGQKLLIGYEADSRLLYDPTNQKDENGLEIGFLNHITANTSWTVGYVNADLMTKYRALSFSKTTYLSSFQDVQRAFECIFQYNTINKVIDVYKSEQVGTDKGLLISDYNFIKNLTQTINHDEIKTRLFLRGKDNISIQSINVTGQPYIENYSFFMTTKYMTQGLIDALNNYNNFVQTKQGQFEEYLSQLGDENSGLNKDLLTRQIEFVALETELKIIQSNIDIAIADNKPLTALKQQETTKLNEINTKKGQITSVQNQINSVNNDIKSLRDSLEKSNHFTEQQLKELDTFIREDEFSDSNYTEDNLEELLESGKEVLQKVSYPALQFDVEVEDFLSLIGNKIRSRFALGDIITLEHSELNFDIKVRLVGYTHSPNDKLQLIFSNRDSVDDANIYLKDLLDNLTTSSGTVDYNKFKWNKGEDVSNEFAEYIKNELDLAKQAIIKGDNQKPIIDERGIWLYKENPDGSIHPEQIRAINNVIALTKDNWNSVEVAITPEGVKAAVLMGQIILGANLKIVSDNGIVEILNNLISIRDDKNKLRVALGNYAKDKYGLLIKDSTGNKTILDEDGILQTWQEGRTDNIATNRPLKLSIFLPATTRVINKAILRFKRESFRAYSTSTESDEGRSTASQSGGQYSDSTYTDTINLTSTKSESFTSRATTSKGYQTDKTGDSGIDVEWTYPITEPGGSDRHTHEYRRVLAHRHMITIEAHSHDFTVPSHTHGITMPQHKHGFYIPSHTHPVIIPSHNHGINYGIYESTKSSNISIVINGSNRTSALGGGSGFNSDQSNLNITQYLTPGMWNTIEIGGSGLGRIDATVFIQALMQFE